MYVKRCVGLQTGCIKEWRDSKNSSVSNKIQQSLQEWFGDVLISDSSFTPFHLSLILTPAFCVETKLGGRRVRVTDSYMFRFLINQMSYFIMTKCFDTLQLAMLSSFNKLCMCDMFASRDWLTPVNRVRKRFIPLQYPILFYRLGERVVSSWFVGKTGAK